jgi:hypothetical protein
MRSGLAISLTSSLALIERFDGQVEELGNELVIQKLAAYLILSTSFTSESFTPPSRSFLRAQPRYPSSLVIV